MTNAKEIDTLWITKYVLQHLSGKLSSVPDSTLYNQLFHQEVVSMIRCYTVHSMNETVH